MLKVRRLQSPSFAERFGVSRQILKRHTDNVSKVDDECGAIVFRFIGRRNQMERRFSPFADLFPAPLLCDRGIGLFKLGQGVNRTQSDKLNLGVL